MAQTPYKQLEQEWKRLHAFRGAMAILRWDAAVMMPRGSADVRGEQLAALETEYHSLVTSPRITRLLDRAQANTGGLEDWQISNLREMRRQRDFAIATPVALVSRLAKAASKAEAKWLYARETGKFEDFAPHLEEVVHLVRDKAQLLGQARNLAPYDALVDEFSPGPHLGRDRRDVQGAGAPAAGADPRGARAPGAAARAAHHRQVQRGQAARAGRRDHEGGRISVRPRPSRRERASVHRGRSRRRPCHHAFRYHRALLGLLGALHETGHAMYDVGLPAEYADQPVGRDRGMALEESQSLLMEMIVCRSRGFVTLSEAAARETFRRLRPRVVGRKPLRAPDAREARADPRRRRRAHLHAAHPAAL